MLKIFRDCIVVVKNDRVVDIIS